MNGKKVKIKVSPIPELFLYWIFLMVLIKGPEDGMKRNEIKKALPEDVIKIRNLDRIIGKILNKMIIQGIIEAKGRAEGERVYKLTEIGRTQAEALKDYFKK